MAIPPALNIYRGTAPLIASEVLGALDSTLFNKVRTGNYPPWEDTTKSELTGLSQKDLQDARNKSNSISVDGYNHTSVYILNLENGEKLPLQFVPPEVDFDAKSNFVAIQSMGRNNPFYHYTGSEDSLRLRLDWVASIDSREDVIDNCNWLVAATKADGYSQDPPRIKIIWGNTLWSQATWLITKAPYTLRLPNAERNYLFTKAIQELELVKVTESNRTRSELLNLSY